MAVSPIAPALIGDMVLGGREIGGQSVVSRPWLDASWEPRTRSPFSGDQYGYGWFLTRIRRLDAAYARAYGGQMLVLVPARRLSIAITSHPQRPARSGGYFGDLRKLTEQLVLAATVADFLTAALNWMLTAWQRLRSGSGVADFRARDRGSRRFHRYAS